MQAARHITVRDHPFGRHDFLRTRLLRKQIRGEWDRDTKKERSEIFIYHSSEGGDCAIKTFVRKFCDSAGHGDPGGGFWHLKSSRLDLLRLRRQSRYMRLCPSCFKLVLPQAQLESDT